MENTPIGTKRAAWVVAVATSLVALVSGPAPSAAQTCAGDCDGNGVASIAELQTAMAIAFGEAPAASCTAADLDGDGVVSIPELTRVLFAEMNGCAAPAPLFKTADEPAAPVVLQIGSAVGSAGQTVSIGVTMQAPSASVAGIQNDIAFTMSAPIAANPNQRPACTVNPAIDKNGSAFAFEPPACVLGETCTSIRALIIALDNVDPIPDGSLLYTCSVAISPSAADGVYPLHGSNADSSDPSGHEIATDIVDGSVTVGVGPTQTPVVGDAPASLILRRARLKALGTRAGRGLGSADVQASVDTNLPFGGLVDDIRASGLTISLSTSGNSLDLGWTAAECAFHSAPHGPTIRCAADDANGRRTVMFRPTRIPNVLSMKLQAERLSLSPPLATDPVHVDIVTASFQRPDDLGGCVVSGPNSDRKLCRETGLVSTPTATSTTTATSMPTVTQISSVTGTPTATWTPTATSIPTATPTSTPVIVPTVPLGERVFTLAEPTGVFAGTAATRTGLFSSYLGGSNAATSFSSGPLVLVGGLPDASGVASLALEDDVTLTVALADGSWACLQLFAAGSSGSIDCDGGTPYDVEASQPTGDVGTVFTLQTGLGAAAAPGNGTLLVMEQGQPVPAGPMPDCSTVTYTTPPQLFAYTTTTATAVKGSVQLAVSGEPFSCNTFSTPGSGGMLVAPAPAYQAPYGDLANVFRLAEQSP